MKQVNLNNKAKIYKPTKTAMQSGKGNTKDWVLEFDTRKNGLNLLTGWETYTDTISEIRLNFIIKEHDIKYAKNNNIDFYIIEPQKRKLIKKSYTDNFLK